MNRENGRYFITDGKTYIGIDKCSRCCFDTCLQNAYGFRTEKAARNFIANSPKAVRDSFYVIDSHMKEVTDPDTAGRTKRKVFSRTERERIYWKNNGKCAICGQALNINFFTVDHIFPLERGGTNEFANLQPACYPCNAAKSNQTPEEFIARLWIWFSYNRKEILRFQLKRMFKKAAVFIVRLDALLFP